MMTAIVVGTLGLAGPPEGPLEGGPNDPYLKPTSIRLATPRVTPSAGEVANVQVNTLRGMNVLGDAGNEPSIAVDPTASLWMAVGWRQFDTIESNFRQAGYSWTVDGGRTWSGINVIEAGVARSDPVVRASCDGRFHYLSLRYIGLFETDLFISEDGARTWPVKHFADGGDHAWLAIDRTRGIGSGNLYQRTHFPNEFNRSLDGGAAWLDVSGHAGGSVATIEAGPEGNVYDAGAGNGTMVVSRSLDTQDPRIEDPTFSITEVEDDPKGRFYFDIGFPPNPIGLNGQAEVSVDHSGGPFHGSVYALATWQPEIGQSFFHIGVVRSDDEGVSWVGPMLASDPAPAGVHRWFGTLSVAPNGRLDVVFNDNREAPDLEPNLTRTYYTFSTDGGETWSEDVPIGPQWDSHVGWPNNNKIGDYYDMESDLLGANLIYATTYNGEQDVYFARIGPYDCNANGVDDEIDIAKGDSGDCNRNDIPDECEIAAGTLEDADGDGLADECTCPADVNGDGALNVLDFVAFQLLWQDRDASADCDRSGQLDVIDFVCFQSLFVAGCD
jgi:hypothetical protein